MRNEQRKLILEDTTKHQTKVNLKFALHNFSGLEPSKTEPKFEIAQFL